MRRRSIAFLWALFLLFMTHDCLMVVRATAQVVQLPTQGTFSVQTSVMVPDGGTMALGSSGSSAWGQTGRSFGPLGNRGVGGRVTLPQASVRVQIIDLDFLDQAILAAADRDALTHRRNPALTSKTPLDLSHSETITLGTTSSPQSQPRQSQTPTSPAAAGTNLSSPDGTTSKETSSPPPIPKRTADYNYMAVLNHPNDSDLFRDYAGDVRYYIERARKARQGSHWSSVQLFYEQAWSRMPPERKQLVLEAIAAKNGSAKPK